MPASPRIRRENCQWRCGWYRDWSDTNEYRSFKFLHPVYGWVTGIMAATRDLSHHDCQAYRDAHQRLVNAGLGYSEHLGKEYASD